MITKSTVLSSCFILFCQILAGQTQSISDTLLVKNFDYLKDRFWANFDDKELARPYAQSLLKKAKQEQIDSIILRGYYFNNFISDFETAIAYCDSIILHRDSQIKEKKWLPIAHDQKGFLYYNKGEYKKSLNSYLLARKTSKKNGDSRIYLSSNYSIGLIKSLIGQKEEALEIYKEQIKSFNSDELKNLDTELYLVSLYSLADAYSMSDKLDSASVINKYGIEESLRFENMEHYPRFVLNEGVNLFDKGDYSKSLDSISKAIPLLRKNEDSLDLAIGYLNNAKIFIKSENIGPALDLLKTSDTIISRTKSVLPEFSPVYELLYENYKKTDSIKKQLIYLEKLIAYNKKLSDEFDGIDFVLYKQYDTPVLIESKERIILALKEKNESNRLNIFLLSIFLGIFCILSFYYYRKRVIYKRRYNALISQELYLPATKANQSSGNKKAVKIPSDILEQLLPKIEEFEKNRFFLNNSITLNKMAKMLGSNSNYLSKTINHVKNKNFSTYISDLRIEYAIQELRTNPKLLNYTIKAIAAEVGFGNTETFTKAFYSKTNLYPSYFIKQLKKEQEATQYS